MENNEKEVIKTPDTSKEQGEQSFWELVRFAVIAILIVIPVRIFIAQPFVVSGSSMFPTFHNGEYLIVDELSYRLGEPKRDDVVIFRYPKDPKKFYIKRIIGLPNETVDINGSTVKITNTENPEGFVLEQPFVENNSSNITHIELKDDEYFVMGDNRAQSSDSRYWGAVKKDLLIGRAFLRLFPISKIDIIPGQYEQPTTQSTE